MTRSAPPPPLDEPGPVRRRNLLFLVLAGFFLTNALLAELVGGKLFQVDSGLPLFGADSFRITLSCGIVLWPVVFIMTDIINEYFGRPGVRRLSLLAATMIAYAFIALYAAGQVTPASFSPVSGAAFDEVFRQSQWIIVGSIVAFLLAQLIDVTVFWIIRRQTGHKMLWLRATGSTVISQLIDTLVVGFIGLYLPYALHKRWPEQFAAAGVPFGTFVAAQSAGYAFKLVVAVAVTPLLYVAHWLIDRYLGEREAEKMIETVAEREDAGDIHSESAAKR